jgi:hypothetical protein
LAARNRCWRRGLTFATAPHAGPGRSKAPRAATIERMTPSHEVTRPPASPGLTRIIPIRGSANRPLVGVEVLSSMMPDGPGKWSGWLYNTDNGRTSNRNRPQNDQGRRLRHRHLRPEYEPNRIISPRGVRVRMSEQLNARDRVCRGFSSAYCPSLPRCSGGSVGLMRRRSAARARKGDEVGEREKPRTRV